MSDDRPPPLVGYRTNEEWQDLLAQVAALIEDLEHLEDPDVRQKVFGTLQAIDALHREALHRLVRLFKEGVIEQVITDPAIHTLMGMYDLLPSPQSAKRKGWDFLTPEERAASDRAAASRSEEATHVEATDATAVLPHWIPVPLDRAIGNGEALIFESEEATVIVAMNESVLHAVQASCPMHGATMHGGMLKGFSWVCPHGPGCVYDIRDGTRLGGGQALQCYPIRTTQDGSPQIGFGIPFEPKLPAF